MANTTKAILKMVNTMTTVEDLTAIQEAVNARIESVNTLQAQVDKALASVQGDPVAEALLRERLGATRRGSVRSDAGTTRHSSVKFVNPADNTQMYRVGPKPAWVKELAGKTLAKAEKLAQEINAQEAAASQQSEASSGSMEQAEAQS